MARLALTFSGGAALAFLPGAFSLPALAAILAALAPIRTSRRPPVRGALLVALVAGVVAGWGGAEEQGRARAHSPPSGAEAWAQDRRQGLLRRLEVLYGAQAPLVGALTLAERRGLAPEVREAFARSGTAHILAISGFHVGVVAGLLLGLLRSAGLGRRRAGVVASAGAWTYVALLGFPDAASRAALILAVVAVSRARGRPAARWGGLGSALLILAALDPSRLTSAGFQLSFSGAAGLVAWAAPFRRWLEMRLPGVTRGASSSVAAGAAATLATLPIVAWHFERVSLVGIPATLVVTPLVVVALPGALLSLLLDLVHPVAGRFVAGGVGLLLAALDGATRAIAAPEWASVWIPRSWVTVAMVGALAGRLLAPRLPRRRVVWVAGAVSALLVWPALVTLQGRGVVEILMVDVGQGDAVAVRTPHGRWVLVDAGPPWRGDPGASPLLRTLRRRGVHQLEALILTHPDLDHIGGAPAVLGAFQVERVLDPGHAVGKGEYLALLDEAAARGTRWGRAQEGQQWTVDGVSFSVLAPGGHTSQGAGDTEANDVSVVLTVGYGAFDALLTGDAPVAVERAVLGDLPTELEVLKVGHHGSHTSTADELLARTRPRVALVSVGRRNRYGHPAAAVLRRLVARGAQVLRTDTHGTVRVRGRRDGSLEVTAEGRRRR